jgi:hypothetical protein
MDLQVIPHPVTWAPYVQHLFVIPKSLPLIGFILPRRSGIVKSKEPQGFHILFPLYRSRMRKIPVMDIFPLFFINTQIWGSNSGTAIV